MFIRSDELTKIIKDWKYIWSTAGSAKYHDWIFFANNYAFCYNGYFYISKEFDTEGKAFALSAQQTLPLLTTEAVEVGFRDDQSYIQAGKRRIEFSYPFSLKEKIEQFYFNDNEGESLVPETEDLKLMFNYTFQQNLEFSNVFSHNGFLYASDGYRIVTKKTNCGETIFPHGTQKILTGEPIRSVLDEDNGVTLWFGDYVLSAVKLSQLSKKIVENIPSKITSDYCIVGNQIFDTLEAVKGFDAEFKKKDLKVHIDFDVNSANVTVSGIKSKFSDTIECECSTPFSIQSHPSFLLDAFDVSKRFDFSPETGFIIFKDGEFTQYLWIGD